MNPFAMEKIWKGGCVWLVEGVFDVLALDWIIPEEDVVLGTLRAKLSLNHLTFLKRFCISRVNMVYDKDTAGRKGAYDAILNLKKVGIPYQQIPYRYGLDPGEIWDKGGEYLLKKAFFLS
jgi:DNA primase